MAYDVTLFAVVLGAQAMLALLVEDYLKGFRKQRVEAETRRPRI